MGVRVGRDTLNTRKELKVDGQSYFYYSIDAAEQAGFSGLSRLPISLRIVLENLLRAEDAGASISVADINSFGEWVKNNGQVQREIAYYPARVLMQDFTGVPAIVDLAAMRDAVHELGGNPNIIDPLNPVDLVIDHSITVDDFGNSNALRLNVQLEYERNSERYQFLKWGQSAFENLRVVPPGTGICHQVNLEYLSKPIRNDRDQKGNLIAFPDTLVGTDSHTTMVNGLAVLGWGVGGIEAEAVMLGQPISMLVPQVVGVEIVGKLREAVTATDLVLGVTQMLRTHGVVGKFVEFFGQGLENLSLADRATIANMAPEYGATCGFFPVDNETLRYLKTSGRDRADIKLAKHYAKTNGLWHDPDISRQFSSNLTLDLTSVEPSISGPKRPQDRIPLKGAAASMRATLGDSDTGYENRARVSVDGEDYTLGNGDIVIAAITSCTNTSNPYVMIAAGLVARKARKLGLKPKAWVKTSLAPGSQVVSEYLESSGLQKDLDTLGFNIVGYGCTTCIGNSGPLPEAICAAIDNNDLLVCSVLSGNRNFEGRINPHVRANYLASPPLVVAYSILGSMLGDIASDPIGESTDGKLVYLRDIWPSNSEIAEMVGRFVTSEAFTSKYSQLFDGDEGWKKIASATGKTYVWDKKSTYVKCPPYFKNMPTEKSPIKNIEKARILAVFGDSITTDHISPAGSIKADSPAGMYLLDRDVGQGDFNSYGARRGNHEIMMRGTFSNIRISNEMLPGISGGFTRIGAEGEVQPIYDAAMHYKRENTPLIVIAGKEYGTGSSRDWAAKGTALLGVRAVFAESFERIHRSNLVGMGVIPFEFTGDDNRKSLALTGDEIISIAGLEGSLRPMAEVSAVFTSASGNLLRKINLRCRIDTETEINYIEHSGILHYVIRKLAAAK